MGNYKEIVTKAVVSKGKKMFTSNHTVTATNPSTILGCWIINHNFSGVKNNNKIVINGSYDVNIWYSYDNDTKTDVIKETNNYSEVINMRDSGDIDGDEIIVRSLKQPNCVNVDINGNNINYTVEKELGIELVGDIKVKIEANEEEEEWDEIVEEKENKLDDNKETIDSVKEEFIEDTI